MKRALVIDDQAEVCDLLSRTLQSVGIEVLVLHRADNARDFVAEGHFDVVFLDLHMSNGDALALLQQIRSTNVSNPTPVILLSEDQRPSALSVAFDAGATFFLYKPLDKERILKLLRAAQGALEYKHRQTRRIPIRVRVAIRFGPETLEGETINMSLTGMLLRSARPLPVGASIGLSLQLAPHMKPLVSRGSVVRLADGNRIGVRLEKLNMEESMRLQEFLLPLIPESQRAFPVR